MKMMQVYKIWGKLYNKNEVYFEDVAGRNKDASSSKFLFIYFEVAKKLLNSKIAKNIQLKPSRLK